MRRSMATTSQLYAESRSIGIQGSPTYMLSYSDRFRVLTTPIAGLVCSGHVYSHSVHKWVVGHCETACSMF
jgi:hypothetical protein